ncbi:DUF1127 domain-containing protein [Loktanella sp. M215]|uniref:DUF1127 domain-containing protein n=1 Tax=Loktanella sp. M215 TaxID=2675431 RepID=UPI001F240904|nr:DUF1127 domain-containing protein [Loktanella sp. M215]MBU2360073.1 DUF1127 domain-containing protein [Alphaproteobacteria bacterium]MCF7697780.1 DUF1127 domain-containing protein [Loktanella sp. M215]
MASLNSTRMNPALTGGMTSGLFTALVSRLGAWNDARITRKSLSQLSARELDDIGLSYGDINDVASGGLRR